MNLLTKIGRWLYGFGMAAVGIHQIILRDFRPEILPPFPAWAHTYTFFPILTGIYLAVSGVTIALFDARKVCIWLGYFFLFLFLTCHIPYILFFNPVKLSHLEVWFGAGEALAYSGGAFVMAGSFSGKPIAAGRIFFCLLIIMFGSSHFVFADAVSGMVPKMFGAPMFWTYFVGGALISCGIAIILNIWIRQVALLLALMLLLFFIFFHVPDAIQNPSAGSGNEIVRAIVCLVFCGIALVIAATNGNENKLPHASKIV